MSPDEVELHARSAKRQFGRLGLDASHIDPLKMRAAAEIAQKEMSAPATKVDIEELKQLILSMKPAQFAPPVVNISYDRVDAHSRSKYQVANMIAGIGK